MQICSLSTILREFVALRSIGSLPFKDLILAAAESNPSSEERAWKISRSLTEYIKHNHNASQQEAINVSFPLRIFYTCSVLFLSNIVTLPFPFLLIFDIYVGYFVSLITKLNLNKNSLSVLL